MSDGLSASGWEIVEHDDAVAGWVDHVRPLAAAIANDPGQRADWLRHGETWFAGVNALGASGDGVVCGGPPLPGQLVAKLRDGLPRWDELDAGQISVCYPGYPKRDATETEAAARFRRKRDAAHMDGLHRVGSPPRRFLKERHAFVLGLPLSDAGRDASPMSIWVGSHRIMQDMLVSKLRGTPPKDWDKVDLTDAYVAARKQCFETCERIEVHARPGAAYVVHRFALHGVAPWRKGTAARTVVYFRPFATGDALRFLDGE